MSALFYSFNMDDIYKTIQALSEGLYKEKGSKFVAFAYPVENEEQIKEIVAAIKVKYYDARHHCYAYVLGVERKNFRMNDDGEPSSTAGRPILGQITSYGLTNILIVVVRYFGGIKLGVSGLIAAYKAATADALQNAVIVEKTVNQHLYIRFDYLVINAVMKVIKEENPEVIERDFGTECRVGLSIRQSLSSHLLARLQDIDSLIVETVN